MFASATLKLTAWYLLILVIISVIFSVIIFELSTSEISNRLERLQIRAEGTAKTLTLPGPLTLTDVRMNQTNEAKASIFIGLMYMNLAVIGLGGVGSFMLARRTLKPIEEAHEAQSRFTSDASHELRTPLAVMKSEIQVAMRDKNMKSTDYQQLMESNLEEIDKLSQLSESLLQLSRLDYEAVKKNDKIDIPKTVKKVMKSLNIEPSRVSFEIPKRPVNIDGNETMINDLLRILFDNAVKYSPKDSLIQFELISNGRVCRIRLMNECEGINDSELSKIFDRFYRSEASRSSASTTSGYGLGLSLAKKIVNVHDGTISASSELGKSVTFTVVLPQVRKNR